MLYCASGRRRGLAYEEIHVGLGLKDDSVGGFQSPVGHFIDCCMMHKRIRNVEVSIKVTCSRNEVSDGSGNNKQIKHSLRSVKNYCESPKEVSAENRSELFAAF